MLGKHVYRQLSAYMHEELAAESAHAVAEHLMACARCRAEFEEIKLGARFAERLELISAPDSLWSGIVAGLDRKSNRSGYWFLKPLAIAAAVIAVATGGFWLWRNAGSDSSQSWQVARLNGSPRIDSRNISDTGRLAVGQWLETDASSRVQIDVATIGNVQIDPNSRVRLLETNSEEHRLELARGRLSAQISAPPKLFFVNTPSGVAEDLGCAYTLEVDDAGDSVLHVTLGWVALELTGRESSVPAGAACAMKRGYGPGTPYFEDATPLFKTALAKFDFTGNQDERTAALASVLSEARPRDAMTLWYLLLRADPKDRASVYDRMAALVAPPQDVTRDGVLNLDRQMLERWKNRLSIRSDLPPNKVHSFWRKLWSETLGRIHGLEGKR